MTKDEQIVVFHDRTLSRITNVSDFPEFESLVASYDIDDDGKLKSDFWVRDFTLAQLKKLSVKQDLAHRPQCEGFQFEISTLEEIIEAFFALKEQKSNSGGLLVELKSEQAFGVTCGDIKMCKKLLELLQKYNLHTIEGC